MVEGGKQLWQVIDMPPTNNPLSEIQSEDAKAAHAARLGYAKDDPFIRRMQAEVLALAGIITQPIPADSSELRAWEDR